MTVSLRALIEEWEVINEELFRGSLESHHRYPFPSNLFQPPAQAEPSTDCPALSSSSSSTTTYARVYALISRTRYIAEDARYTSCFIVQHLLWVTLVAWANQLSVAAGGLVDLPSSMRQRNDAGDGSPARMPFSCPLLAVLEFWDPHVLAETASGPHSASPALVHRAPKLREVWNDGVQRILAVWCTPTSDAAAAAADASSSASLPSTITSAKPKLGEAQRGSAESLINYAYVWVLVAQHYHRFKALLSLYFLRYDAFMEELEDRQLSARHPRRAVRGAEAGDSAATTGTSATPPPPPARRRGLHLRVPSDASLASTGASHGVAASPTPALRARGGNAHNNGVPGSVSGEEHRDGSMPPRTSPSSATPPASPPSAAASPPRGFPTTARLLALLMRHIENANLASITEATAEAVVFLLMPPVHRARLRAKTAAHRPSRETGSSFPSASHGATAAGLDAAAASPAEGDASSAFLETSVPPPHADALDGEDDDDAAEDEDQVVWSSPPSPLLSFSRLAKLPREVPHTPVDAFPRTHADEEMPSYPSPPQPLGRVQKEEHVIRNVFKLLLMTEDCRVHAVQHWLVETGKHVVAIYGAQLASLLFEESSAAAAATGTNAINSGEAATSVPMPLPTARTLAGANRVLRETLQSYVRLRTKLLFLNAGTTHFLGALTPWGRTRMLETLNAFLCGFCGVTVPPPKTNEEAAATAAAVAAVATAAVVPAAAASRSPTEEEPFFTPTNAAVAEFTRTWGVPLWLAMCDDAQQRLQALQEAQRRRQLVRHTDTTAADRHLPRLLPTNASDNDEGGNPEEDEGTGRARSVSVSGGGVDAASPASLVHDTETAGGRSEAHNPSVASGDLADAVSCAASAAWPPTSPTSPGGHGGAGVGGTNYPRTRGRGLNLKRVLQQQQRRGRLESLPQHLGGENHNGEGGGRPRLSLDNTNNSTGAGGGRESGALGGGNDESLGVEESLYTAETASMEDVSFSSTAAGAVAGAAVREADESTRRFSAQDGEGGPALPSNSVAAAVAAARHRRRRPPSLQHVSGGGPTPAAGGVTQRLSRAAQLHQVATLPDEGFPSLLYLMPRRSRFVAQDRAAAAVQQQLFTRFSSDVHHYLTGFLAECEAAETEKASAAAKESATNAAAAAAQRKSKKKADGGAGARPPASTAGGAPGDVKPLPQPVLARMIFLLDMTYAALQGSSVVDSHHGRTSGPLMETGLTATGQEQGAGILEQENGEFESVVSTTLSAPTSPALLTIAAVRKGFQGFLAAQEKRAVLTLAQALYGLVQQGNAQQPPAAPLDAVDTILNMAALLSSKDMFVSLMKGYLAPSVMLCRSVQEIAVESQVVARMAYRLGAAVAAPCLTLLRDLRLAISDTRSGSINAGIAAGPLTFAVEPASTREFNDAYDSLNRRETELEGGDGGLAGGRGMATAEGAQLMANRNAQTLAAAGPLRHGAFGLIHHVRVLCQAWWQPHTAVLLSSRKLQRLWERYQLLDERVIDAVLRVEWRYDGHTEPFYGYGRLPGDDEDDGAGEHHGHSSFGGGPFLSNPSQQQQQQQQQRQQRGHHHARHGMGESSSSLSTVNTRRGGAAAAVIQGFSSVLGNAVRRTGHHAGAFGNNESDNESEDYSEAYGGLLTLSTLQRHRNEYAPSNSSYRGSNVSSVGGGGGGGRGGMSDFWDMSDGGQSTVAEEMGSTTAPPPGGERERRQLRWPLSDGQLVFLLFSKATAASTANPATRASQAVQIAGPPLTLLVCQLLDRAVRQPHSFDTLHKALPVQTPKPLLAHLLHELVKVGVVVRRVPAGTRQYVYQLRDDMQAVPQRKVVVDVRAAAQQQWIMRTLAMDESDTGEDAERGSQADPTSPASPRGAGTSFPVKSADPARPHGAAPTIATAAAAAASSATDAAEPGSPAYSADRTHKIKVCIVRVMKAERVLPHHELLARVTAALEDQFVVSSGHFKRCVGHLIEKEFLQRGDGGDYMYVS